MRSVRFEDSPTKTRTAHNGCAVAKHSSQRSLILRAGMVAGPLFLAGVIDGVSRLITYKTAELGATNRRVLAKIGWIRHQSLETLLAKVEAVGVALCT